MIRRAYVLVLGAFGCVPPDTSARPDLRRPPPVAAATAGADGGPASSVATTTAPVHTPSFEDAATLVWRDDGRALAIVHGSHGAIATVAGGAIVTLATSPSNHTAIVFSPNGKRLASIGEDGVIRLFDTSSGALEVELPTPDPAGDRRTPPDEASIAFAADGSRLVAATDRVRVWDTASRTRVCTIADDWLHEIRVSPDAKEVIASSLTGNFGRWSATSCAHIEDRSADTGGTFATALSPDSRWLASSEQGHGLKIHQLKPKGERLVSTPPTTCAHHVVPVFSRDGRVLVVTGDWFRSYRVPGFTPLASWTPPPNVRDTLVDGFDDGVHVILRDDTRTAIIDVRTPSNEVRFDPLGAVRFRTSPDSAWIAGVTHTGVAIWSATTGKLAQTIAPP